MITVSLCMIVKNEEKVLARCLDSVADLVDEIVIVDTGSTDNTKAVAAGYTDKIYDLKWTGSFSDARNYAAGKATMDYIYSADADEVLDEVNRERFRVLKANLLPEIEIVQMKYGNQLEFNTVYNFDEEYRPKLYKRCRTFQWIEPIHECLRLDPVVYDSDIVITHMPTSNHGSRDLERFRSLTAEGGKLSGRLHNMYARELFMAGTEEDLAMSGEYFTRCLEETESGSDAFLISCAVLCHRALICGDTAGLMKASAKTLTGEGCSEVCCDLGSFYEKAQDWNEAAIWYYNAAYETGPVLSIDCARKLPLNGLVRCYEALGNNENAEFYRQELIKAQIRREEI